MPRDPRLQKAMEGIEEYETYVAGLTQEPNPVPGTAEPVISKGVGEDVPSGLTTKRLLDPIDQWELFEKLKTKSEAELNMMLGIQLRKENVGVPFHSWLNAGGSNLQQGIYSVQGADRGEIIKAVDSTGASALIRQDLEPLLLALFVKRFPMWDRIAKEPANGLTHAWNQITAYADPSFLTELGTVTDSQNTYVRKTQNIAVLGVRVGVSLKSQYAVMAGGMPWNLEQQEINGALTGMAHKMQKTIFQGNASNSGGTASNDYGLYDVNAFDGLRWTLTTTNAVNFDPTAVSADLFTTAIDSASTPIIDAGGLPTAVYMRAGDKQRYNAQLIQYMRAVNTNNFTPGLSVGGPYNPGAMFGQAGELPIFGVPGDSIGTYTAANYSSNTVGDVYVLDEGTLAVAHLGPAGPTVLDIPIGISGQLTHLYIVWLMGALVVKALPFNNKARAKQPA